jgi:hypothetical protein
MRRAEHNSSDFRVANPWSLASDLIAVTALARMIRADHIAVRR